MDPLMDPLWTPYGPSMDPLWTLYGSPYTSPSIERDTFELFRRQYVGQLGHSGATVGPQWGHSGARVGLEWD